MSYGRRYPLYTGKRQLCAIISECNESHSLIINYRQLPILADDLNY